MITYVIQVSIALVLFYLGYLLCLKQQTNFALVRGYLLFSLLASIITPLINFRALASTFIDVTPEPSFEATWLPEVTITAIQSTTQEAPSWLTIFDIIYVAGVVASSLYLIVSISKLKHLWTNAKPKKDHQGWYYLLPGVQQSFSFFNYIFLGDGFGHSEREQKTILAHERAHVRLGHSFDVLFVRLIAIVVWFNPLVYWFKHKLGEVHEFQADAETILPETINEYCELLARETLVSNQIHLANHFNKSLTLKRIAMILSFKKQISMARLSGLVVVIVGLFAIISCEEKVLTDLKNAAKQSVVLTEYPEKVRTVVEKVKAQDRTEPRVYGLVKTADIDKMINEERDAVSSITYVSVDNDPDYAAYVVVSFSDVVNRAEMLTETDADGPVFTIVEEMAQPANGMTEFYEFIATNMKYPEGAKKAGVEGRVFTKFLVDENGLLSDFEVIKGVGSGCDEEAIRVLKLSKPWLPAKQKGIPIKSIFNLVIIFKNQ